MLNGHGGDINEICSFYGLCPDEIIDFSASISPLGYPDSVRRIILDRIDSILNYPDSKCIDLQKAISEKHSCRVSNIIVGNGSNELFYLIPRALRPRQGIIIHPTFSEFKDALNNSNVGVVEYEIKEKNLVLDINKIKLHGLKEGMVFICNPNNPTGHLIQKEEILKFTRDNPKHIIVVDEAFMDFVEDEEEYSLAREAVSTKNLIVVRSLTKFYGFPGLRLGYLIACESNVNGLLQYKEPWTVNTLAQAAGLAAINDIQFTLNTKSFISREKSFLFQELLKIRDLRPFSPSANFILIRIDTDEFTSGKIKGFLAKKNIIIRDCSNFVGLNDKYFRVAVKTRKENQMLLDILSNVIGQGPAAILYNAGSVEYAKSII